jgi:hypothetical protein
MIDFDRQCAEWCFGEEIWNLYLNDDISVLDLFTAWNEKHNDLMFINDDHLVLIVLQKMKQFWKASLN